MNVYPLTTKGFVAGNHNRLEYFETHEEALEWARNNTFSVPTFVAEITHNIMRPAAIVKEVAGEDRRGNA
jgi:hypothetical protein